MKQKCLMLGAGFGKPRRKLISPSSLSEQETDWMTLDNNPKVSPDFLLDLELLEKEEKIPIVENSFDEVHAYEVLEHFGHQGDYKGLFSTFRELWRILRPSGLLIGSTPSLKSEWLWGDPSHTRVITHGTLSFLRKEHYKDLGQNSSSDFRALIDPCWWEIEHSSDDGEHLIFALRKV